MLVQASLGRWNTFVVQLVPEKRSMLTLVQVAVAVHDARRAAQVACPRDALRETRRVARHVAASVTRAGAEAGRRLLRAEVGGQAWCTSSAPDDPELRHIGGGLRGAAATGRASEANDDAPGERTRHGMAAQAVRARRHTGRVAAAVDPERDGARVAHCARPGSRIGTRTSLRWPRRIGSPGRPPRRSDMSQATHRWRPRSASTSPRARRRR